MFLGTVASASPENLEEMQIIGSHPGPTESVSYRNSGCAQQFV